MYADDTSITFASCEIEKISRCVNSDLERIRIWLAANTLTLNMTKTEFLLICSRQRMLNFTSSLAIKINQIPVKQVSTTKSLGVYINENLTWERHITELSKKIAFGISAIKRIRYFVPRQTLITIYISMVQSHFYYCSVVWGCCSQSLSQKLQKFQNCAARVVTFSYFDSCTEELFRELFWGKLDRQRCVDKAIMMYKIVNGAVPQYLCSCFVQRSDTLSS